MENLENQAKVISEVQKLKSNSVKAIIGGIVILMCFFLVVAITIAVVQMGM